MKPTLTPADFERAAAQLACEVAAVRAVAEVETRGAAFLPDGRPVILFERHIFHKLTRGKWSAQHPDISSATWGGYGAAGDNQHARLAKAAALDRAAALQSASWGMFQLMGFNYAPCGFADLQSFINAMYSGEPAQLAAFVSFIQSNPGLLAAIRAKSWAAFARGYNGADYARNAYDTKMAATYRRLAG